MKFNHACDIAFVVISDDPKGKDFTPEMLFAALEKRLNDLRNSQNPDEILEAVGAPFDTYETDDNDTI